MSLREDFKGSGNAKGAAEDLNRIARALNNSMVIMPANYTGDPATVRIAGDRLVIDMSGVDFSKII